MHAPDRSAHTASPLRRWPAFACLLAVLGAVPSPAAAQPSHIPAGSTPHFRHLSDDDGLVSTSVSAVAQDPAGYMWIATDSGLQRYDGYRFITYTHDPRNHASLGENVLTALAFGPDGSLWLGTQDAGLDHLSPGSNTFTHYQHDIEKPESLGNDRVFALLFDRLGRLWIATNHGLDRMDAQGAGFHHYITRSTQPNGERILSLYEDTDGRLWVGSDHGVFYYDAKQDGLTRFEPMSGMDAARKVLADAPINAFCRSHDGRLWIGTEHGLAMLSRQDVVLAFYTEHLDGGDTALKSDHVRGIMEGAGGGIWLIALHGGLSHLDEASGRFTTYSHDPSDPASLSNDDLGILYRDRTGLLWIGGLRRWHKHLQPTHPRLRLLPGARREKRRLGERPGVVHIQGPCRWPVGGQLAGPNAPGSGAPPLHPVRPQGPARYGGRRPCREHAPGRRHRHALGGY